MYVCVSVSVSIRGGAKYFFISLILPKKRRSALYLELALAVELSELVDGVLAMNTRGARVALGNPRVCERL